MANFYCRGAIGSGTTWSSSSGVSYLSFGAFIDGIGYPDTDDVGIVVPFHCYLKKNTIQIIVSAATGSTLPQSTDINCQRNGVGVNSGLFPGGSVFASSTMNVEFAPNDILNINFSYSSPTAPYVDNIISIFEFEAVTTVTQAGYPCGSLLCFPCEIFSPSYPLSGRFSWGAGANNSEGLQNKGAMTIPQNMTLVGFGAVGKNSYIGSVGSYTVTIYRINGQDGTTNSITYVTLSNGSPVNSILTAPNIHNFKKGDSVYVSIDTPENVHNLVVGSLYFVLT